MRQPSISFGLSHSPPFSLNFWRNYVHTQLSHFISSVRAIPVLQSGFRRCYSTTTALLSITDFILRALDFHTVTRDSTQLHLLPLFESGSHSGFCPYIRKSCVLVYVVKPIIVCVFYIPLGIFFPLLRTLLSQSLVVSLLDDCDVVYSPFLTSRLSSLVQRIQNSCLRFSYCVRQVRSHLAAL